MTDKRLMSLKEFQIYLGIGKTKAREIVTDPDCIFSVRVGNRLYVDRYKFDKYLEYCEHNNCSIG